MKRNFLIRMGALTLIAVLMLALVACGGDKTPDIYSLTYKGTKITLGASADGVLSAMGEYKSKTEIGDCGGLGAQVKYVYDDITLYVLEGKNGNTVDSFTVNNDMLSTNEGVCIGDDEARVTEIYGTPTARTAQKLEYQNGEKFLVFDLDENGSVSGIEWKIVTAG